MNNTMCHGGHNRDTTRMHRTLQVRWAVHYGKRESHGCTLQHLAAAEECARSVFVPMVLAVYARAFNVITHARARTYIYPLNVTVGGCDGSTYAHTFGDCGDFIRYKFRLLLGVLCEKCCVCSSAPSGKDGAPLSF